MKFYNTEFDKIIITFTGQNGKPLWREDKVNFPLINGKDTSSSIAMQQYSLEPRKRKYVNRYGFYLLLKYMKNNYCM